MSACDNKLCNYPYERCLANAILEGEGLHDIRDMPISEDVLDRCVDPEED